MYMVDVAHTGGNKYIYVSFVFYLCIFFILFLRDTIFLTIGFMVKGNSQEKRVPSSSVRNGGR
jgi:hypothetical protein